MDLSQRSMAALWLSGLEDDWAQQRSGELCVVEVFGREYDDVELEARRRHDEGIATYVEPYGDPDVIAAQGTVAVEVLEDWPECDAFVVPTCAWHQHACRGQEVAVLFAADDRPTLDRLGLYWEESA